MQNFDARATKEVLDFTAQGDTPSMDEQSNGNTVNGKFIAFVLDTLSGAIMFLPAMDWETVHTEAGKAFCRPVFGTVFGDHCVTGMWFNDLYFCSFGIFDTAEAIMERVDREVEIQANRPADGESIH